MDGLSSYFNGVSLVIIFYVVHVHSLSFSVFGISEDYLHIKSQLYNVCVCREILRYYVHHKTCVWPESYLFFKWEMLVRLIINHFATSNHSKYLRFAISTLTCTEIVSLLLIKIMTVVAGCHSSSTCSLRWAFGCTVILSYI